MDIQPSIQQIASRDAPTGAQRLRIRSHVCSSASSAAPNASVYHQERTVTNRHVHATTTGRPRKEDQSVLEASFYV
ncbi:hypothetical protein BVC80_9071g13 [Macleaya cordata]|uniref:Uncharacterized protein n=1 Tax=Macleaya cordata TaxID=56857 RepID=A0A200PTY1_MACCD|nr:hypothetical protein BVC80_9071g13 [Macleaya cordata]